MNGNKLLIRSDNTLFQGSRIELNGKSFPVTKLTLKGDIHNAWKCKAEFFVKGGIDIDVKVDKINNHNHPEQEKISEITKEKSEPIEKLSLKIKPLRQKLLSTPIENHPFELSTRIYNFLRAANIKNLAELIKMDKKELLKFRSFGRGSLNELSEYIESLGLSFGMDVNHYIKTGEVKK